MENGSEMRRGRKKAVNVTVDETVLAEARTRGVNLSRALEAGLEAANAAARADAWRAENRDAIEDYNRRVDEHGSFGDRHRRF